MICPLIAAGIIAGPSVPTSKADALQELVNCSMEECAWWIPGDNICSVRALYGIAISIDYLTTTLRNKE